MGRFGYLDFLRDVGKHFPVNVMLHKDSVAAAWSGATAGMSYTEFSYMLLQAYDFVHLYEAYGCELQVGGSDQWGNITAGIDAPPPLARRFGGVQLYGCTCPLLTRSDGAKMGKTESGALWLSAQRTSPYQFYQVLDQPGRRRGGPLLAVLQRPGAGGNRLRSDRAPGRSQPAAGTAAAGRRIDPPGPRRRGSAHGRAGNGIFFGAEISELSDAQLAAIFADVPSRELPRQQLCEPGLSIIDALVEAGLAKSKGDARRVITQGGAYVNNRRVEGIESQLTAANLASESTMILRTGKKNYALLRFV